MKEKALKILRLILPVLLLSLVTVKSEVIKESCRQALSLCAGLIIPSLFPFFVLSGLLTQLGLPGILGNLVAPIFSRIYGISPAGSSALLMGLIGGYPSGANYIADLENSGIIKKQEGERLIAFCNNSGPAFIVGVMGTAVFNSSGIGLLLYTVHVLSALITGLFFKGKEYSTEILPHSLDSCPPAQALVIAVKASVSAILNVCGFVVCFSMLLSALDWGNLFLQLCVRISQSGGLEPQLMKALLTGFLELGNGAAIMCGSAPVPSALCLAAFLLGFGGLSVHFQTLAVLSKSNIKGTLHLAGRLINATVSACLMYIFWLILK